MKKQMKAFLLSMGLASTVAAFGAMAADNGGVGSQDAAVGSLTANQGAVFCTAAVNSDGSLASKTAGSFVSSATKLGTGQYQVLFKAPCNNVTAAAGFARWVQVDTLTTGTTSGHCETADRAGSINGVWINCEDNLGNAADRSFFLFVAR